MKISLKLRLILLFFLLASINLYSKQYSCISNIYITGNKITKNHIIQRELPFKQGDTINVGKLDEMLKMGRNNLLNLSLFNYVYVTKSINAEDADNIDITINVEERWYVWPLISFVFEDRNLSSWLKEGDANRITVDAGAKIYNIWGLNHILSVSYKFGYQKGFRFEYNNIALGQTGKHRVGFGFYGQYSKTENFMSEKNSPKYNSPDDEFVVKKNLTKISYTFKPKIRISHSFAFNYESIYISDTILKLNPKYWGGENTVRKGIGFNYAHTSDQRDNIQYPLEGYFIKEEFRGYLSLDNSLKYGQIRANLQYYYPLSKRWNISANLSAGVSKKNTEAYIFDSAIGYENVILRGYEYYVADGQHYITFNPTLKYKIMPTVITVIDFLSFLPQFNKVHFTLYGKAFFDMGYSYHSYPNYSNFLSNKFLCSGGIGLDIVSYYDLNLSIDYSFNQLKEHGFFLSIKSILF